MFHVKRRYFWGLVTDRAFTAHPSREASLPFSYSNLDDRTQGGTGNGHARQARK